jgi:hypothetical protein
MFQGPDIELLVECASLLSSSQIILIPSLQDFKTLLDDSLVSSQFQMFLLNTTVVMFYMILTKT